MGNVVQLHRPTPQPPAPKKPAPRMVAMSADAFESLTEWLSIPDLPTVSRLEFINILREKWWFEPLTGVAPLREKVMNPEG